MSAVPSFMPAREERGGFWRVHEDGVWAMRWLMYRWRVLDAGYQALMAWADSRPKAEAKEPGWEAYTRGYIAGYRDAKEQFIKGCEGEQRAVGHELAAEDKARANSHSEQPEQYSDD